MAIITAICIILSFVQGKQTKHETLTTVFWNVTPSSSIGKNVFRQPAASVGRTEE
jgi:hypothetical protein